MNEQIIILIFLVLALGATLWLYILKAKKQVEYKGDERWLTIQLKANQSANIANWTLIILLAIATSVPLFIDIQIMFTLDRVILFGELFIGLRNLLELIAIMYFDGDNVKVKVAVKFIDNQTKATQVSQYELVLHKDSNWKIVG